MPKASQIHGGRWAKRVDPIDRSSQADPSGVSVTASGSSEQPGVKEEGPVYDPSADLETIVSGEHTIKSEPDSGTNTPLASQYAADGTKAESTSPISVRKKEDDSPEVLNRLRPPRCGHQPWLDIGAIASVTWSCSIEPGQGGMFKVETQDARTFRVTQMDKGGNKLIGDVRHWYPFQGGPPDLWEVGLGSSLMYDDMGKVEGLRTFCFMDTRLYHLHKQCRLEICRNIDKVFHIATGDNYR